MPQQADKEHLAEDRALVQQFKEPQLPSPQRDQVFRQLLTRHQRMVHTYCLQRVRDRHIAEDVTQLVFLALWKDGHEIENPGALHSWLRTVAARGCGAQLPSPPPSTATAQTPGSEAPGTDEASTRQNHHKKRLLEVPSSDSTTLFEQPADGDGEEFDLALLNVHAEQLLALLDEFVKVLPQQLQRVYILHVREKWDGPELTRRLNVTDKKRRQLKSRLLKQELRRLVIANTMARATLGEAGCKGLADQLRGKWSTGPLPLKLVTKVMSHISDCKKCGGPSEECWRQWRPWMLPLMVDSDLRRSILDHVESTAATADLPDASDTAHQPGGDTGTDSALAGEPTPTSDEDCATDELSSEPTRVGLRPAHGRLPRKTQHRHRITVGVVGVLCVLAGCWAWQVFGPSALTTGAGPSSPSASSTASGFPGNQGGRDSHGDARTNPGANPGTNPGTNPGANPGTNPGTNPGANPGTNEGSPPPPASRTLVVHLTAQSDGGIAVTANGLNLGSCSKAREEAAKDCVYTVHDGDTVQLTPEDFVYSWGGAPCAGVDTRGSCAFPVSADTGFNLSAQRDPG
jgi:DNA-directed RNA polymerase specialized sigma subunit, sigma24 homolog